MPNIKYVNGERKFIYSVSEQRYFVKTILDQCKYLDSWDEEFVKNAHLALCFGPLDEKRAEILERIYSEMTK